MYEPAEVPAAAEFTMKGRNLDLIVAVEFAGGVKVRTVHFYLREFVFVGNSGHKHSVGREFAFRLLGDVGAFRRFDGERWSILH